MYLGEGDVVGAASTLECRFTALSAGSTTLQFEYFFQGAEPEEGPEVRSITVTVTP